MSRSSFLAFSFASLLWGADATAQPVDVGRSLGSQGNWAISDEASASIGFMTQSSAGSTNSGFRLALMPSVDYFVADNFSVGGAVGVNLGTASSTTVTELSAAPRVGYAIPLSSSWTLWPRLGLALDYQAFSAGGGYGSSSAVTFGVLVDAPILYQLAQHFFIGVAPTVNVQFVGDTKSTSFMVDFVIGGWL